MYTLRFFLMYNNSNSIYSVLTLCQELGYLPNMYHILLLIVVLFPFYR